MPAHDVIIIGSGLAGLTAACVLTESGRTVTVLEGSRYAGGRIRTVTDIATGRALADLGPTWVWPTYQPVVAAWLHRLRIATFPQYDDGDGILDGWGAGVERHLIPGQAGIARVVGGPGALIAALAARLPEGTVSTGRPVARVEEHDGATIGVGLASGETLRARFVILAVPLRVAASTVALPGLDPALMSAMRRTPTWMSSQAKAVALYDRPFWRAAGLSGRIASRNGPLGEAHDHTPHDEGVGAIFGFVGWSPSQRRADPPGLQRAIVAQLGRCLGPQGERPTALHIQDWATSPFVATAADIDELPEHPAVGPTILRTPQFDGRLLLAASETSHVSPGLIEGALAAGERAAQQVLAMSSG